MHKNSNFARFAPLWLVASLLAAPLLLVDMDDAQIGAPTRTKLSPPIVDGRHIQPSANALPSGFADVSPADAKRLDELYRKLNGSVGKPTQ